MIFDGITLNVGNHYNPATGHFTCPKTGVYAFSLILMSEVYNQAYGNLVKEGKTLALALASNPKKEKHYFHTASYVVAECKEGERIWVQCYIHCKSVIYGEKFCTFSGHFLGTQ